MDRLYRGPGAAGRSKATASTLCQKCLKRDNYECKAAPQERPYTSRPSRTQQLLNPALAPKLTSDVPNDLLRKKGVADELLAKKEEEKGRKPHDDAETGDGSRWPRSPSSSSVSTISTNISRASSPQRARSRDDAYAHAHAHKRARPSWTEQPRMKRRRSESSSDSYTSSSSYETRRSTATDDRRNIRRRHSSRSPFERGRARSRSETRGHRDAGTRSPSTDRRGFARRRPSSPHGQRDRGRDYPTYRPQDEVGNRRASDQRSRGARDYRDRSSSRPRRYHDRDEAPDRGRAPRRMERSLSPFSKRLALTQAMNMGR